MWGYCGASINNNKKKGGLLWYVNWFDHTKSVGVGLHLCQTMNNENNNVDKLSIDGDVRDIVYLGNHSVVWLFMNGKYSVGNISLEPILHDRSGEMIEQRAKENGHPSRREDGIGHLLSSLIVI